MKYNVSFYKSTDYEHIASIKGIGNYEAAMTVIRELKKSIELEPNTKYILQLDIVPEEGGE